MKNTYLFHVNYQGGTGIYASYWLPYTAATIWAYVEQFEEINRNFLVQDVIFKREPFEKIINRMKDPQLCLFSTYSWNEVYNLSIAQEIKQKWPNCTIVFGGPQVDDDYENFLNRNKFVDSVVVGEGEVSLHQLLLDLLDNNLKKGYDIYKRTSLDHMPSPFVNSKILDKVIKENPNVTWSCNIETNRGCPFACTFCNWGSLTQSKIKQFNLEKVFAEIDWFGKNKIDYMYVADANFGVFHERDKLIAEYIVKTKKETGFPRALNMTWYKNSSEKVIEIVKILDSVGLARGLTLSVQSMNDKTLESIKRKNMEVSQLGKMYQMCNDNNLRFYTEFIIGLPYETKETWRNTLCTAIDLGCHNSLEFYSLDILKNSELSTQIDEHQMEIFPFDTIEPNQETQIPEKHNYVISTKYMSRQDMIDGW
jgi:radical SAM superfamily enzyme YgiQ (UPF0313 family)